jgi:hypothetical protein
MPTDNYSHMVMENKHMVVEDSVDDDGVEETLENSPLRHGEQDQSATENKDHGGGDTLVQEKLLPSGGIGF